MVNDYYNKGYMYILWNELQLEPLNTSNLSKQIKLAVLPIICSQLEIKAEGE